MTSKQEWAAIGRFVGTLVTLYTLIAKSFKEKRVGIEILEWLTDKGSEFLCNKVKDLSGEYYKSKNFVVEIKNVVRSIHHQDLIYLLRDNSLYPSSVCLEWEVFKNMPRGVGEGEEIIFFPVEDAIESSDLLLEEYDLRDLRPASPFLLLMANLQHPNTVLLKRNATIWRDSKGEWCWLKISHSKNYQYNFHKGDSAFLEGTWFAGVPKKK